MVLVMFMRMIVLVVMMVMSLRTGSRMFNLSTTGLAVVPTAVLPLDHPDRQVARQQVQLARQGHRHIHIGDEVF